MKALQQRLIGWIEFAVPLTPDGSRRVNLEQPRWTAGRAHAMVVLLMLAFSVMSYFNRTILSIAAPRIINEFSLSETEMGSIYSAFLLSYGLLMIPGGHLADRLGPRLVLTWMGFGSALFTGLTALAGMSGLGTYLGIVPSFLLIRLGMEAFTAPLYPLVRPHQCKLVLIRASRASLGGCCSRGRGGWCGSPFVFAWMMDKQGWRCILLAGSRGHCAPGRHVVMVCARSSI